jgi:1-aminocyclopropane-1-carboxylate deaminase
LALAGKYYDIATIGFIRGDKPRVLSPTLQDAIDAGMQLHFVSRTEYRQRNEITYLQHLQGRYSDAYIIPEGGSNLLGVRGCMEIVDHIKHHLSNDYDVITTPCGTAATLAGLIAGSESDKQLIGFSVLKNAHYLNDEVVDYLLGMGHTQKSNWDIQHGFHCGGYAKVNMALANFMQWFESMHSIPIEPIYSGKMFYGLYQLLQQGSDIFPHGSRVVAIHTGGLQGLRGMEKIMQKLLLSKKEDE